MMTLTNNNNKHVLIPYRVYLYVETDIVVKNVYQTFLVNYNIITGHTASSQYSLQLIHDVAEFVFPSHSVL